jgi:hypothetical protein
MKVNSCNGTCSSCYINGHNSLLKIAFACNNSSIRYRVFKDREQKTRNETQKVPLI